MDTPEDFGTQHKQHPIADSVGVITIYGIPMGFTIIPVDCPPEVERVIEQAIKEGKTPKQIWRLAIKHAPSLGTVIYKPKT